MKIIQQCDDAEPGAMTAQRVKLFHLIMAALAFVVVGGCSGKPALVRGATSASIILGTNVQPDRLTLVNLEGDGATTATEIDGVPCHLLQRAKGGPPMYMYLRLDSSLKIRPTEVLVTVEYFDATSGMFMIDYDSLDEEIKGTTRARTRVDLKNDKRWHKAAFLLENPRFEKRQHDGGDFRIALTGEQMFVRSVKLVQD